MGNGKCFIYFIAVDLWLIFIFQGWEMGCVLESGIYVYCNVVIVVDCCCCGNKDVHNDVVLLSHVCFCRTVV